MEVEKLTLVGGTHDGERHEYTGPSLMLPKRGAFVVGYVSEGAEPQAPPGLEQTEVYVVQVVVGHGRSWRIYMEVERRGEAIRLQQVAEFPHERARDFAAEAARADCAEGVNRVFSDWAYAAIIDAQIAEAQASALFSPDGPPVVENPPDGGETLH